MSGKDYVATTVRVPTVFLKKIQSLAEQIGDSQNGLMLNLMFLGMKVYEDKTTISFPESPVQIPAEDRHE